jgi:hypothetical protein
VRHFASAEAQRDLDLVALVEKPLHGAHFHVVVVIVDHRTELDLLDFDDVLSLAGLCRLLLRLEFEFAVIQDLADGRDRIRRDLDEIEPCCLGHAQGGLDFDDAFVVAGAVD